MRINEVLRYKAIQEVITVRPDVSVRDLISLMVQHNVGALVVSSDGESLEGIVSERDVVRRLHEDPSVLEREVVSIMTREVHTCEGDHAVDDLMELMTDQRIRHVPVVSDGKLSGIISIGDVVKNRIKELEFERDQLDSYVHQT